ncbi:MAG: universal stress protein [Halobacteriales archaeon]
MRLLVPVDGSDCSERALRFAADLARRFEGSLHVVHVTDRETEATETIMEHARDVLAEEGIEDTPEVTIDVDLTFRAGDRIGEDILRVAEEGEYDHVVMGHHGGGVVDRLILGSAAETVLRAGAVPVTVVP